MNGALLVSSVNSKDPVLIIEELSSITLLLVRSTVDFVVKEGRYSSATSASRRYAGSHQ